VELISTPLAVVLVVVGAAAMAMATVVARREPLPSRTGRPSRLAPLVPWIGSLLIVVLLVRGALAGAGFVALVTLAHVGLQRYRAATSGRDRDRD
jgi:drug/metabolite transporter (DMT)-like permease